MMEELKKEVSSLREFVVLQSKEIVKLKRGSRLENETDDYNRLACIEEELSEQKRSQDKITRLCQAAIKALERIEDKPIISTNGSECSTPISTSKESVCGSIDPTVVKSLCGQIEKLTSMLVKVDEDIDDLDERTEDNKQQVDGLRERFLSLNDLEKRMSGDYLRREVDARIMIKDLVTKSDLSRGLKTIPFGLSKDDVSSMIEYATSNYLRTVQVCGEKLEDFEEKVNMELKSLQNKVVDIEETLKNHLSNIEDKTDKRIKEVEKKIGRGSGDLEVVVRELDTKVKDVSKGRGTLETKVRELEVKTKELEKAKGTGMESVLKDMDTKIKSVDSKNKDFTSKMKDFEKKLDSLDVNSKIKTIQDSISSINNQLKALKDDNKANSDEARVTARLERLGKEISVLKTKHVDIVSTLDDLTKRKPTQGEPEKLKMLLDQNIQNNEKMLDLENAIQQINAKVTDSVGWVEHLNVQVNGKMDKTDVDDLKTGMEKERCKIQYFQDRINNIAKSMDAVKQEINTIRDRFYSDIECNTKDIKELKLKSENQEKVVKENSDTLKHITKDSIGKIKDVSSNCLQIEKNIRSIKDKSERFEAKIEWMQAEIKGLGETHGTLITEIQQRLDYIKDDKMNSSKISDSDLAQLQNSVKSVQTDLKNLIQDKKTMDFEDEERKLSMESSLLDLRNYVENILTETNSQLGSIASEVENSHDKILKCGLGLEELINKYEADKIDYETLFTGMDAKLKEMSDYAESKQLDSIDKILQLRKEFVDKHAEYLEMSTNNRNNIDALKSQVGDLKNGEFGGLSHELQEFTKETNKVTSRIEAEIENIHRKHSARFVAIEAKHSNILTELNTVKGNHIKSNEEASASFNRLDAEMKTYESEQKVQAGFLDTLAGRLSREERDAANRLKEIKDAQSKMRNEIDTNTKQMDALHKELEVRLDNCRRNLLDIISSSEIKVQELEDRIKQSDLAHENYKIFENNQRTNFENKLSDLKQMVSATSASTEKVKNQFSEDAREEINRLKTNFENLKRDVLNLDIAGFKASINNTNTTQNKQLQTLFEGIDALKKEACQHTLTVNKLDGRVASMVSSLDSHKSDTSKHNKTEEDARTKMEERINNLQTNIRELYEKLNQRTSSEDLKKMNQSFELWKKEINEKIQSQQNKIVNVENSINLETSKMKESVLSSINTEQQNTNKQIQLLQKNIQEKSEPLEKKLQQYKKEMTDLESSLAAINTSLTNIKQSVSQDITRTDNLETAFTNIKSQLSAAESNINSYAKDSEVQKLKDTINKMTATKSLENLESKLESMYAHSKTIDLCMGEVKSKGDDMEKELKTVNIKLEKLKDIQAVTDELKSLENKVNQQKTKVIDVEASVQFQERSIDKLGEDVKKINGSVFGNISNVDDRLSKLDETTENLKSRVVNIEEKSEKLSRDIDSVSTNKNQMDQVNAKVGHRELEKLQSQVNDEVSQLKKNHKHIEDKLESFITTSKKDVESMKTSAKADLENLKKSSKADIDTAIRNLPKQDLSQYTMNSQFKTSISSLQENIDNIQKKMQTIKDEGSSGLQKNYQQIKDQLEEQKLKLDGLQKQEVSTNSTGKDANENLKNSVLSLEKGMKKLEDEIKRKLNSQQENQLSLIDKQRRTWETTREKAEQMSQIFESLIITNDRPYVSCGIGSNIDMAGMIIFNQFELINKIEWEEENGFNLVEPGVYILQISATLANCTLSVKLVSEQLEAELLALTSASEPMAMFKSRSTIFTVEDDDRDAEKIVVDIIEKDSGECLRVDSDLSVIMYKISEVSNSENAGELWRIVDE